MSGDHAQRRYARQFVLQLSTAPAPAALTTSISWGGRHVVHAHPWLRVERAALPNRDLLSFGHLVDPADPSLNNEEVVARLCGQSTSFARFERASASLAGRWAALLRIGSEERLYPDAAGMRSVFYSRMSDGTVVAASQPTLLASSCGLKRSGDIDRAFLAHRHSANSWPCELTPYPGIRQLLPNHFLDLNTGEVCRFWPTQTLAEIDINSAVDTITAQLNGVVTAALRRGRAALAMTGGYDSRTLFAAAGASRTALHLFCVTGAHFPWYDFSIPRRLVRRFGGTLHALPAQSCSETLHAIVRENVARMWWDPGEYVLNTFGVLDTDLVLFGWLSEIGRCFYYPDGRHPTHVDGRLLARLAHFGDHTMAIGEFERWLTCVPALGRPALLDLFYWEHRAGNWASLLATACDTFCEPIPPFNCRTLLETALALPVSFRRAPYELHRRLCEHSMPGALEIPFNFSWRDALLERVAAMLPWRLRHWRQPATRRSAAAE